MFLDSGIFDDDLILIWFLKNIMLDVPCVLVGAHGGLTAIFLIPRITLLLLPFTGNSIKVYIYLAAHLFGLSSSFVSSNFAKLFLYVLTFHIRNYKANSHFGSFEIVCVCVCALDFSMH